MIGVIARPEQLPIVEEFFELFKTPWECYEAFHRYDAVIATTEELPEIDAALVMIFGASLKSGDTALGLRAQEERSGACLEYLGLTVPIYGELSTFAGSVSAVILVTVDGRPAGLKTDSAGRCVLRLGYDLFDEVRRLLTTGQPVEHAHVPTLDAHVAMIRDWILRARIPLVEIPPTPNGYDLTVCLTHDIDFVGIRRHVFDHSIAGFLYRSTFGAVRDFLRGRLTAARLVKMWRAVVSLPFVYLGWARDFWEPFGWYLQVEKDLPATYYFIPFKGRPGDRVPGRFTSRRAAPYDVMTLAPWPARILKAGCEIGVHGIDAWNDVGKGRAERARIAEITGSSDLGVRMHWLLQDAETPRILEQAGYIYDSTKGYNDAVGFRNGTAQAFRPLGAKELLELPMHIQDGALFSSHRLDLSETEAWRRCADVVAQVNRFGGVVTLLWHDRSHGPERFWGDFYTRLVQELRTTHHWFATAKGIVQWFRERRTIRFAPVTHADGVRISAVAPGHQITPPLTIRFHTPPDEDAAAWPPETATFRDVLWNGTSPVDLSVIAPRPDRHGTTLAVQS